MGEWEIGKKEKKAEAHRFCGLGMHFCGRQHWDTENAGRARALVALVHLHFTAPVALSQMEMESYGLLSRSGSKIEPQLASMSRVSLFFNPWVALGILYLLEPLLVVDVSIT